VVFLVVNRHEVVVNFHLFLFLGHQVETEYDEQRDAVQQRRYFDGASAILHW